MRQKTFRPAMDTMEPRIALSGFFGDLFDSLLGRSSDSSDDKPKYTPAQIAKFHAKREAAREARIERLAEWRAAHPRVYARRG